MNCNLNEKEKSLIDNYSDVKVVSVMKNVMWKGGLEGKIELDTISDHIGLYGLGPV